MKTFTAEGAAEILGVDISRIQKLCRTSRLGYTLPRHGRSWVITEEEISQYRAIGPKPAGRPAKKA